MIPKTLVQSIAAAMVLMAGSTSAAVPNQGAIALTSTINQTTQHGVDAQKADYFIVFHEAGVMSYDGGIASVASTEAARSGGPLQVNDSRVVAYRDYLAMQRRGYLQALAAQVSDPAVQAQLANPAFVYDIVFHGIALEGLSEAQAAALRNAPGVKEITLAPVYELDTDRVQTFVGAGGIWDGSNTSTGVVNRGKGGTIAVIDTGLTSAHASHGSFMNDTSCGFSTSVPKVVSALDCTTGTACSGTNPFSSNNPHGSHTAATVGGNDHIATGGDLVGKRVSGIAPCAQVFTLKGCSTTTCASTATAAAAQKIIEKQAEYNITAVNYSIGGGTSPWSSSDINRSFLDMVDAGIFVAASAGNTRTETPNPIAAVNHRGPWVTTVANSTHDRVSSNNVDTDMGGPVSQYGLKGGMSFPSSDVVATLVAPVAANALGCNAHGSGALSGKILLVSRGECSFEIKMNQASAAGASGVIVVNNTQSPFPIAMGATENATIPGVMVSGPVGAALAAHLAANPATKATIRAQTSYLTSPTLGDVLADSSLRGPVPTSLEITKPDITGPGTNIFAAYDSGANSYDYMTGTSMSGPHVAGAGALVKNVNPNWTPMEVRSALMMTASRVGSKDFINGTPNSGNWDADDVGSGRLDLTKAAKAGLVMHETKARFLAASGSTVNQRALNMPSMRNVVCTPTCTFTRTVRNTSATPTTWAATANGGGKLNISVSPASFSFTGGLNETKELTISVTPIGAQTAAMAFGHVLLNSTGSPEQHMTVSIKGTGPASNDPVIAVTPASLSTAQAPDSTTTKPLTISNSGGAALVWTIDEQAMRSGMAPMATLLYDQTSSTATNGTVAFLDLDDPDYYATQAAEDFTVPAGATWTIEQVYAGGFYASTSPGLPTTAVNVFIYADAGGKPGAAVASFPRVVPSDAAGKLTINLPTATTLTAGTYWLSVQPERDWYADGPWYWLQESARSGAEFHWRNPGDGFESGCEVWGAASACLAPIANLDLSFRIYGEASGGGGGVCDNPADVPWLALSSVAGTTAVGASDNVTVSFNSTGLAAGSYTADLCVNSNDPANALVVVPVSMTVGGSGDPAISVTPTAVSGTAAQGASTTAPLAIANIGGGSLDWAIHSATTAGGGGGETCDNPATIPWLSVTPASGSTAGGASSSVSVAMNATGLTVGSYSANLCVTSNDTVKPLVKVPVSFAVTSSAPVFPAPYCAVTFPTGVEPISRVVLGGIDNPSSPTGGLPLENFLSVTGTLSRGATYPMQVEGNTDGAFTNKVKVFIDWNQNDTFEASEGYALSDLVASTGTDGKQSTGTITVPANALVGSTRMRVVKKFNTVPEPCNAAGYGQAEDYTIVIDTNPPPVPLAAVDQAALSFTAAVGASDTDTLQISNIGDAGSQLTYAITRALAERQMTEESKQRNTIADFERRINDAAKGLESGEVRASETVSLLASGNLPSAGNVVLASDAACATSVPGMISHDHGGVPENGYGWNAVAGLATMVDKFTPTAYPATFNSVCLSLVTNASVTSAPVKIVVYAADGAGGVPGTLLGSVAATANNIGTGLVESYQSFDISSMGLSIASGSVYIGVEWDAATIAGLFLGVDESSAVSAGGYVYTSNSGIWEPATLGSTRVDYKAMYIRAVEGAAGEPGVGCDAPSNVAWLSATPISGTVIGVGSQNVTVKANATGLAVGTHEALLCVNTNDALNPRFEIPVTFEVTPAVVPPCSAADTIFCNGFEEAAAADPDVVTGVIDLPVIADGDGSTLDLVTGQWGTYNPGRVDDLNLYDYGDGTLTVYWYGDASNLAVGGVTDSGGVEFAVLQSGAVIGPSSVIGATSLKLVNWNSGQNGYLGVAFENETTGQLNYGYIRMTTTGPTGFAARVLEYAYNKAGNAITIP